MCAPTRYTTRHRSVKRIFSFSSGTLNRLGSLGAVTGSARDSAARLLDLRAGRGRHRHALHAELALHVAHAEQLDRVGEAALRDAADERHLAALEAGARLPARARGLALAAPPRRLADPRARAAPLADARAMRSGRSPQSREGEVRELGPGRLRPWLRLSLRSRLRSRLRLRLRHAYSPAFAFAGVTSTRWRT